MAGEKANEAFDLVATAGGPNTASVRLVGADRDEVQPVADAGPLGRIAVFPFNEGLDEGTYTFEATPLNAEGAAGPKTTETFIFTAPLPLPEALGGLTIRVRRA